MTCREVLEGLGEGESGKEVAVSASEILLRGEGEEATVEGEMGLMALPGRRSLAFGRGRTIGLSTSEEMKSLDVVLVSCPTKGVAGTATLSNDGLVASAGLRDGVSLEADPVSFSILSGENSW